ncbi:MAG: AMIN domain-containing protein, partial [Nitrospinaceae bacterium]
MIKKKYKIISTVFSLAFVLAIAGASSASVVENMKTGGSSIAMAAKAVSSDTPVVLAQNGSGSSPMGGGASKITRMNAVAKGENRSIISIDATGPLQYTAFKLLNPLRLILDFPDMEKGELEDQLQINKGVVESIRSLYFHEAEVLRLEIVLTEPAEYDIQKPLKNKLVIYLQKSGGEELALAPRSMETLPSTSPEEGEEKDEGHDRVHMGEEKIDPCAGMLEGDKERISLDFQGASIRNLLRIISDISGFNLILSNEVSTSSEKVHMRLLDVPWNRAFEVILKNSGMGVKCSGDNIIRVASLEALAKEEKDEVEANKRKQQEALTARLAEPLLTEVVQINYANIDDLAKNLNALLNSQNIGGMGMGGGGGAGGRGQFRRGLITVDKRTNKLILTDIRENIDDMLGLIRILDIQTPQVMIEARIVEVNKEFSELLGVQWGLTGSGTNPNISGATNLGNTTFTTGGTNSNAPVNPQFMVDLSPGGVPLTAFNAAGIALGFKEFLPGIDLDVQIQALEREGHARLLSAPKVTTLDNKEAKIKSGRKIPFETVSAQGTQIQFVDAELSLTVTPRITSDDYIYMIIDATNN